MVRANRGNVGVGKNKPARLKRDRERITRRDKRRLARLITSAVLFLVVFTGRGAFPIFTESCRELISTDTDWTGSIKRLGLALQNKEGIQEVISCFYREIIGKGPDQILTPEIDDEPIASVVPLSQTGRYGLDYACQFGITKYMPGGGVMEEPEELQEAVQEIDGDPMPEIVAAVAQVYDDDGNKLPSNVSFVHYELGLSQITVPVFGEVTSGFGYRINPITGENEFHLAVDIAAEKGTDVAALSDGTVRYIGESDEFGLYLMIDHANGVSSFYAHCSKLLVRKGETVVCGQTVALVGDTGNATGPHLHLTILKDNIRLDPSHYVQP